MEPESLEMRRSLRHIGRSNNGDSIAKRVYIRLGSGLRIRASTAAAEDQLDIAVCMFHVQQPLVCFVLEPAIAWVIL